MARIFIGLPLSDEALRGVKKVMKVLARRHWPVKWESPDKWHLTVVFLGQITNIETAGKAVGIVKTRPSFNLKFKGLGRFPEIKQPVRMGERVRGRTVKAIKLNPKETMVLPKVIFMGFRGELQSLTGLRRLITANLGINGIDFDRKPFQPHLTLGRVKSDSPRRQVLEMATEIEKMRDMDILQEWQVDRVNLYESQLTPTGSRYRVLQSVKLQ